jgi:hypothetical protein
MATSCDTGMMLSSWNKFLPHLICFYSGWIRGRMHAVLMSEQHSLRSQHKTHSGPYPQRLSCKLLHQAPDTSALGPAGRRLLQENVKVATWAAGPGSPLPAIALRPCTRAYLSCVTTVPFMLTHQPEARNRI